jgi:hypothetical protein
MNLLPLLLLWMWSKSSGKSAPHWPSTKSPPPRTPVKAVPRAAPKAAAKGPFAKAIPKVPKIPHMPHIP